MCGNPWKRTKASSGVSSMRGMGFSRSIWGISHTFSGNGCWYLLVGDSCGIRMRKYYRGVQKWLIIVVTHHGLFRIVYLLTIRGNMSNDDGIGITKMQSEIWSYPGIFSISFFHFLGIAHHPIPSRPSICFGSKKGGHAGGISYLIWWDLFSWLTRVHSGEWVVILVNHHSPWYIKPLIQENHQPVAGERWFCRQQTSMAGGIFQLAIRMMTAENLIWLMIVDY